MWEQPEGHCSRGGVRGAMERPRCACRVPGRFWAACSHPLAVGAVGQQLVFLAQGFVPFTFSSPCTGCCSPASSCTFWATAAPPGRHLRPQASSPCHCWSLVLTPTDVSIGATTMSSGSPACGTVPSSCATDQPPELYPQAGRGRLSCRPHHGATGIGTLPGCRTPFAGQDGWCWVQAWLVGAQLHPGPQAASQYSACRPHAPHQCASTAI